MTENYAQLHEELHARPFPVIESPRFFWRVITKRDDDAAERETINGLLAAWGYEGAFGSERYVTAPKGDMELRIEPHQEFTSYTWIGPASTEDDSVFVPTWLNTLPQDWLAPLQSHIISQIKVAFTFEKQTTPGRDALGTLLGDTHIVGNHVTDKYASVWSSFKQVDNATCFLVLAADLSPRRAGRLAQRLLEIETYRTMAMLTLTTARQLTKPLKTLEDRLAELMGLLKTASSVQDERRFLDAVTDLAVEVETLLARDGNRFQATEAYGKIFHDRLAEIRQERVHGYQTLGEFLDRRVTPALRNCEATYNRLEKLSQRIDRATDLLRSRVDINLEEQNQAILASVNRRAELQLRLQQTVEGLSVIALSYYAVGLMKHLGKALGAFGLKLSEELVTAISMPIVIFIIWRGVHHVRKLFSEKL